MKYQAAIVRHEAFNELQQNKKYAVQSKGVVNGLEIVKLRDPENPAAVIVIARELVEFLNEVVDFVEIDVKPAIQKGKGIWQRFKGWFFRLIGKEADAKP